MKKISEAAAALSKATVLNIKGTDYALVMTDGVLIEFEALTGINTITDADKVTENPSRTTLTAMLFVLLKHAGADFTIQQVRLMLRRSNTHLVYAAILSAWVEAIAREDGEEDPIKPAQAT